MPTILLLFAAGTLLSRGCRPSGVGGSGPFGSAEDPDQSAGYLAQALAAIHGGDNRNAQQFLVTAVDERAQTTTLGEAYASVSKELLRHGDFTQAVTLLEPATRDPKISWSPLIWAALAAAYRSADDSVRSETCLHQADTAAAAISASSPAALNAPIDAKAISADRFLQLGAWDIDFKKDARAAIAPYRTALSLEPGNPGVINKLGALLADAGTTDAEFDEAIKLTKEAVKNAPENSVFLDACGWAQFRKRNYKAALRLLTSAVTDDPDAPDTHYHLGELYVQLGQNDDAAREFARVLALRPEDAAATEAKRKLETSASAGAPPVSASAKP